MLTQQAFYRQAVCGICRRRFGRCSYAHGSWGFLYSRCDGCKCRGGCCINRLFAKHAQYIVIGDQVAGIGLDAFQNSVSRRGYFEHHFIGFKINQVFIAFDGITGCFVPL